ncbi:MAG: hypothetical protein RR945_03440 [Erysipelotrichaceae bacterium]
MLITITFENKTNKQDFQLNSKMKIKDALAIINKNSQFQCELINFVFSKRLNEVISSEYTFQEAKIYSGDCLSVEED